MVSIFQTEEAAVQQLRRWGFKFDFARLAWERKDHWVRIEEKFERGERKYQVRQVLRHIV